MKSIGVVAIALLGACKGHRTPVKRDAAPAPRADASAADAPADAAAKAARPEHTVWKLVDNRALAHRAIDGELVLDARTLGFARYTRFDMPERRWALAVDVGGERGAIADRIASLEVPIIPEQPPATQLTARVYASAPKQALEVRINGRKPKTARMPLEAGWQIVALPLDAGMIVPGENIVALQTVGGGKQQVGFSWLRFGSAHPAADQDPLAVATFDDAADAIDLADHASLTWYVTLPEGAHLVADVAAPCSVEVGARAGDASFGGGLLGGDQDRVDLSAMSGKAVRLTLTTRDCPRARLVHPRITVHGPEPLPLPKAEPPRNVVLWWQWNIDLPSAPVQELLTSSVLFRQFAGTHAGVWEMEKLIAPTRLDMVTIEEADAAHDKPMFIYLLPTVDALEPLVAKLKSWGAWDTTMLLITDGTKLVVHDPARYPGGVIVDEGVEGVDLLPSIFDALGLPPPSGGQGAPLAPLAQGIGRGWQRPSYEVVDGGHAMQLGHWRIRVGSTAIPIVTDITNDSVDLAGVRFIERRMLTDALGVFLRRRSRWRKSEWGVVTNLTAAGARALDAATP